jgi:hypothetical protein
VPFPIQTDFLNVTSGPELLERLEADALAGGGTVIPALGPSGWIERLLDNDSLNRQEAIGLAAALIQKGTAATACEGARLAAQLNEPSLGALILHALDGLDIGELLTIDPVTGDGSTEDTLLICGQRIIDHSDKNQRHALLIHLRRAGLTENEFALLTSSGSPTEIRLWLPAILQEVESLVSLEPLNHILARGDEYAEALALAIHELPLDIRQICQAAAPVPTISPVSEE